jgi:hypothetical protein
MSSNPANLRWQYLLEDLGEIEVLTEIKAKIKSCLDSLDKYPLVIHDADHCLLLRHFDQVIVNKMKARIEQEERAFGNQNPIVAAVVELSPIRRPSVEDLTPEVDLAMDWDYHVDDDNAEQKRRDQEEKDFELAMLLSQEEDFVEQVSIREFPKPSAAFQVTASPSRILDVSSPEHRPPKSDPDDEDDGDNDVIFHSAVVISSPIKQKKDDLVKVHDLSSSGDEAEDVVVKKAKTSVFSHRHDLSSSDNDKDLLGVPSSSSSSVIIKKAAVKKRSIFAQDPVFSQHLNDDNSDDDGDDLQFNSKRPKAAKKKKTAAAAAAAATAAAASKKSGGGISAIFSQDPVFKNIELSSQSAYDGDDTVEAATAGSSSSQKKKRRKRNSSEYCPRPGSGGYAILIALYQNESKPGLKKNKDNMTKKELCEAAQPFANESMTYTKPGVTQWYNGWSASTTLAKKELIEMWSNPRKIKLTEAGRQMAIKIMEKRDQAEELMSAEPPPEAPEAVPGPSQGLTDTFDDASWLNEVSIIDEPTTTQSVARKNEPFKYCYVGDLRDETDDQNKAEVDIGMF